MDSWRRDIIKVNYRVLCDESMSYSDLFKNRI